MTHEVKSYKWRGVEHLGMFLLKVPQFNYTEKSTNPFFFSSLSDNQNPSNSKNKNKKAHAAVMLTQHITAVHA